MKGQKKRNLSKGLSNLKIVPKKDSTLCIQQDTLGSMEPTPREVLIYETAEGKVPFESWLAGLKDAVGRALIRKRINRVRLGNLGNNRSVGNGVWELKIDFGPGYRVYYGEDGSRVIVLICGGDKGSQDRDILKAKEYWRDYLA